MLEYSVTAHRLAQERSAYQERNRDARHRRRRRTRRFQSSGAFHRCLAACMIKGIKRVSPTLKIQLREVEVRLYGARQHSPPKMVSVDHQLIVDTDDNDRCLELRHKNVRKYGRISNTAAAATQLTVCIVRRATRAFSALTPALPLRPGSRAGIASAARRSSESRLPPARLRRRSAPFEPLDDEAGDTLAIIDRCVAGATFGRHRRRGRKPIRRRSEISLCKVNVFGFVIPEHQKTGNSVACQSGRLNRRSPSEIATSLMLASRRRINPSRSNSQSSLP